MKQYRPAKRTLNAAAESGDIESIMYHLLEGADINGRNGSGHFPLGGAVHYGHTQAVMYLIKRGAKINMLTSLHWTPLYIAASRQHLEIAKVLLSAGASTKPKTLHGDYGSSYRGFTALHISACNGDMKMVRLLLKHGADPRTKADSRLPEDIATDRGHKEVARLLRVKRKIWR